MQMSYSYASDIPFKNFCKLSQHAEAIRKKLVGKRVMKRTHIVDKSTDHDKPHVHFDLLLTRYERQRKLFFLQSASLKRHCVTH